MTVHWRGGVRAQRGPGSEAEGLSQEQRGDYLTQANRFRHLARRVAEPTGWWDASWASLRSYEEGAAVPPFLPRQA